MEVPCHWWRTRFGSKDEGSTSTVQGRGIAARGPRGEERLLLSDEEERPWPFASHDGWAVAGEETPREKEEERK